MVTMTLRAVELFIILIVTIITAMGSSAADKDATMAATQEVRLFTLAGQSGASTTTAIKCDDASTCSTPDVMDNSFDGVCVDGLWIFYSEIDYAGDSEFHFGSNTCADFAFGADNLSSFRYVGSLLDWMKPGLTLYREDGYRGQELYKSGDGNSVISGNSTWRSLFVSGLDDWTLYSNADFSGVSVCIGDVISSFGPGYIDGIEEVIGVGTVEDGYRGQELYKSGDGNSVISGNSTWRSLFVSGLDDWTLYSNADFSGVSVCIGDVISSFGPGYIDGIEEVIGVGTVGSVRRGCFK
ncbi:unnamed protein product [Notodromas monacha]|uniref:Uncharacterized protein n=1 Tax=Notodromas monacha TaxID=399045 RepID=A0A7R9GDY1_9CRUS|nr:unnamed protein product [Notodromas monacha]CAG0917331.1 unnamed protein product [Notodromas monacha]